MSRTPSPRPPRSNPAFPDRLRRPSVRGVLVVLVVLVFSLMAWQLRDEYALAYRAQVTQALKGVEAVAEGFSTTLASRARTAATLLAASEENPTGAATALRGPWPQLIALARYDRQGKLRTFTGPIARIPDAITPLAHGTDYRYATRDGGVELLLNDVAGHWLVLLPGTVHPWTNLVARNAPSWALLDTGSARVLDQASSGPAGDVEPLRTFAIPHSEWQVDARIDTAAARQRALSSVVTRALLYLLAGTLTVLALLALLKEQKLLRLQNVASRRSLQEAASALAAIDEPVLVSGLDGRLHYLNRRAAEMFGLVGQRAQHYRLLELVPTLAPHLGADGEQMPPETLIEIRLDGEPRCFVVNRSTIGEEPSGHVWVLRDVTEAQRAVEVLKETQRRYQDIFEGSGVALCVLDLAELRQLLMANGLTDAETLAAWLQAVPDRYTSLLERLRITEANETALRLLDAGTTGEAWQKLIGDAPIQPHDTRFRLIAALLGGQRQLEMEMQLADGADAFRHLWLNMRLPELSNEYHSVTLSIQDITSRKRGELELIERERFWSGIAQAVPDTLYVHDLESKRVMFNNNRLGRQLGYERKDTQRLGRSFWDRLVHPDDSELFQRVNSLQQVLAPGQLLTSQVRLRHRDGHWRWFDLREQAVAHDEHGRVSRLIGIAKDVTEQIEASESLRSSERRYRLLAESISDVIFSSDNRLTLDYISPSIHGMLGYLPEDLLANGFHGIAANPLQLKGLNELIRRTQQSLDDPQRLAELRRTVSSQHLVVDCLHADGRKIPVELRVVLMWNDQGQFQGMLGVGRDISRQRRAEKDMRMAATVFEHSTAAILVTDPAGFIVQVNRAFSRITGYQSREVVDQMPAMLTADRQQANQLQYIMRQLDITGSWEGEVWLKRRNGETYPAWIGITAVQDEDGDLVSYVCFFSDIGERKASEQRIHRLAYYDALTQLPNRTLFQDRLHTALQHAQRHNGWVVLMFLDLDRFKPINDSLGHAAGDRMLKDVAQRLSQCVEQEDTVARMGGDEFTLLLQASDNRDEALNRAIHVAERILESLSRSFVLEGREFFVTASIGIALSPQDGNELSQLMKNADTAMYHAKEMGKNNFQFYQADMNARALERLELESDLRHALENRQFKLYYQPQFSGDGRRLTGVEALLRWQHPVRGLVSPSEFIPVLEEVGLVVQVGDWALAEACSQLKAWHGAKVRVPKVSVNLSARQFADGQLGARISRILESSGLPPSCLELELTESILMRDVGEALSLLAGLKRLGVCIAVDDFGTGYSSLNYLKQFPIDVLKIDRSFVDGLPDGEQDAQIARAIIAMAHSLNLSVIAEGVETEAQLKFLRDHDCDEVQGYLFSHPIPAALIPSLFLPDNAISLN